MTYKETKKCFSTTGECNNRKKQLNGWVQYQNGEHKEKNHLTGK